MIMVKISPITLKISRTVVDESSMASIPLHNLECDEWEEEDIW